MTGHDRILNTPSANPGELPNYALREAMRLLHDSAPGGAPLGGELGEAAPGFVGGFAGGFAAFVFRSLVAESLVMAACLV